MKRRRQDAIKGAGRPANAWPRWKLFAYLPDRRRWSALRLVQLVERGRPWQFRTLAGAPALVGLFDTREWALRWAKTHCDRVVEDPMEAAS
jgi:hypothetical protein